MARDCGPPRLSVHVAKLETPEMLLNPPWGGGTRRDDRCYRDGESKSAFASPKFCDTLWRQLTESAIRREHANLCREHYSGASCARFRARIAIAYCAGPHARRVTWRAEIPR